MAFGLKGNILNAGQQRKYGTKIMELFGWPFATI